MTSDELDLRRTLDIGVAVDPVLPVDAEAFAERVERALGRRVTCTFWGVRGTLPVPGRSSLRYGGNTSCVSVTFPNDELFVFDAGTGIRGLSNHLMARTEGRLAGKIFISHPHWDHLNALPFFAPLYLAGNEFEIHGPASGGLGLNEQVAAQMDGVFFPITMREFAASIRFRDLGEEALRFGPIEVRTMLLHHPGRCLGYRIDYRESAICYVTDNELIPPGAPGHDRARLERLIEFVRGADALITDATYTDGEYPAKAGWGHSAVGQVVDLAHRAEVSRLYLFHHDPDQGDDEIDAKLADARLALDRLCSRTQCFAPAEGDSFRL